MTWEPLQPTFCAESREEGVWIAHTFYATDRDAAERFSKDRGWTFVGELVDVVEVDDETVERIAQSVKPTVVH